MDATLSAIVVNYNSLAVFAGDAESSYALIVIAWNRRREEICVFQISTVKYVVHTWNSEISGCVLMKSSTVFTLMSERTTASSNTTLSG